MGVLIYESGIYMCNPEFDNGGLRERPLTGRGRGGGLSDQLLTKKARGL